MSLGTASMTQRDCEYSIGLSRRRRNRHGRSRGTARLNERRVCFLPPSSISKSVAREVGDWLALLVECRNAYFNDACGNPQ